MAGKAKVVVFVITTVLAGDDVLDMKRQERKTGLGKLAVLATIQCADSNFATACLRNTHDWEVATIRRALA